MIELNLLPRELRKRKNSILPDIPVMFFSCCVLFLVISAHLVLGYVATSKKQSYELVKSEWKKIKPKKKRVDKINNDLSSVETRLKVVEDIASPKIIWTDILGGINSAMVPDVWLNEFHPGSLTSKAGKGKTQNTGKYLMLSGFALGGKSATSSVSRFIESLKRNRPFSKYFEEIKLQNMRSRNISGEEVMAFTLICRFKDK